MNELELKEAIKELKRDIIGDFEYRDIEIETNSGEGIQYRCENLIYENEKVLYYCQELTDVGVTLSGGSILYYDRDAFLKESIANILTSIKTSYFYNVMKD